MDSLRSLARQPEESSDDWADRLVDDMVRYFGSEARGSRDSYLAGVPGLDSEPMVVITLLPVEWELRRRAGDAFSLDDYLHRFASQSNPIRLLWEVEQFSEEVLPGWYTGTGAIPADFAGYCLERELGGGGQARVLVARGLESGGPVALKVPRLEAGHTLDAARRRRVQRERFLREARRMQQLDLPGLCPAWEVGESHGLPFFTMPYFPRGTVADELARGPMAPERVAAMVGQVARVMQSAHDRGVLHRDLKPSNLLVTAEGGVVVGDLGMSLDTRRDERLTSTDKLLGTLAYLSPEQVLLQDVGPASDQFSLGVVLYELCSGQRPFQGNDFELLMAIIERDPVPLTEHRPDIPPALVAICKRALAKRPEQRYPSMAALAADLERFRAGTWTAPQEPPPTLPLVRPALLTRAAGSSLALIALIVLIALSSWGLVPSPPAPVEAPTVRSIVSTRRGQGMQAHLRHLRDDLAALPFEQRRQVRYLSLLAVHDNPYVSDADYEDHRTALVRLLNRLSHHSRDVALTPVGSDGALLRLDLRDLDWHPNGEWQQLVRADPYRVRYDAGTDDAGVKKLFVELCGLAVLHPQFDALWVRGDWLLSAGSQAPLFDVLQTGQEQPRTVPPFDLTGDDALARLVRRYDAEIIDDRVAAAELGLGSREELAQRCKAQDGPEWKEPRSRADWAGGEYATWIKGLRLGVPCSMGGMR